MTSSTPVHKSGLPRISHFVRRLNLSVSPRKSGSQWCVVDDRTDTVQMTFDFYSVNCLVLNQSWEGSGEKLDSQAFPYFIITINDTCTCDVDLIITMSDTSKNWTT